MTKRILFIAALLVGMEFTAAAQLSSPGSGSLGNEGRGVTTGSRTSGNLGPDLQPHVDPDEYMDVELCPDGFGGWFMCDEVQYEFVLNGFHWPGDKPNVMVYSSTSLIGLVASPPSFQTTSPWNNVGSNIDIRWIGPSSNSNSVIDDHENIIIYDPGQCPWGGACAAAIYYHVNLGTGEMNGFDIVLYGIRGDGSPSNYTMNPPAAFQTHIPTVVMHELGHALGLDHSSDQLSVMAPGGYGWMTTVNQDDENGLLALYGAAINNGIWTIDEDISPGGETEIVFLDYGPSNAGNLYYLMASDTLFFDNFFWPDYLSESHDSRRLQVDEDLLISELILAQLFDSHVGFLDAQGRAQISITYPEHKNIGTFLNEMFLSGVVLDPFALSGISETMRSVFLTF